MDAKRSALAEALKDDSSRWAWTVAGYVLGAVLGQIIWVIAFEQKSDFFGSLGILGFIIAARAEWRLGKIQKALADVVQP